MLEFEPTMILPMQDPVGGATIFDAIQFAEGVEGESEGDDIIVNGNAERRHNFEGGGGGDFSGFVFPTRGSPLVGVAAVLEALQIDSDGDGTPDAEDAAPDDANEGGTIVVTSPLTQREAMIVDQLAASRTSQTLAIYAFLAAFYGWEASTLLELAGLSPAAARGVTGVAAVNGLGTSMVDAFEALRESVHQANFRILAPYVRDNPSEFENFILVPNIPGPGLRLYDMNDFDN